MATLGCLAQEVLTDPWIRYYQLFSTAFYARKRAWDHGGAELLGPESGSSLDRWVAPLPITLGLRLVLVPSRYAAETD